MATTLPPRKEAEYQAYKWAFQAVGSQESRAAAEAFAARLHEAMRGRIDHIEKRGFAGHRFEGGAAAGSSTRASTEEEEHMGDNGHLGAGPERQAAEGERPSRFRPRYRKLEADEVALHDAIKTKAAELEELYGQIKPSRETSLGLTKLEESVMWAVKGLTS
jgi:hypothetical protein